MIALNCPKQVEFEKFDIVDLPLTPIRSCYDFTHVSLKSFITKDIGPATILFNEMP